MAIKIELEFIPYTERLPELSGYYIGHVQTNGWGIVYFDPFKRTFVGIHGEREIPVTHWAALPDLSKAKEPSACDIGQAIQQMKELELGFWREEKKRRREVFLQVALASPQFGYPSWSQKLTSELAEEILKAADKFARGES
jgi:hypothetical protein